MQTYLREAYILPLIITAPLVLALLLMQRWFVAHNYWQLGIQLLICGMVYTLGLGWAFLTNNALRIGQLADKENSKPSEISLVASAVESYQQDA